MQLIESYLHEVGRFLPQEQRDDILGELRISLEEEVTELAGTDNPTRDQVELVLNKYGHPINVASAYKEPRFLIGPELYPAFIETMSTVFTVSVVAVISLQMITWVTNGWGTGIGGFIENVIRLSLWLTAIIVISFATLEYYGERIGWFDNWKASSLSNIPATAPNRSDLMTNLVSEGVFLLWWNKILVLQNWIPGVEGRFTISLSEVWAALFWPVNILAGLWFIVHAFTLLHRHWTRPALVIEIAVSSIAFALCLYLVSQPELILTTGMIEAADLLERSLRVTIVVIAGFIAWDWWQAVKLWRW
ncbi:MAG: hypothetical protein AB8G18_14680 [Gammaproteobacteria bacterium]